MDQYVCHSGSYVPRKEPTETAMNLYLQSGARTDGIKIDNIYSDAETVF